MDPESVELFHVCTFSSQGEMAELSSGSQKGP